MKRKNIVKILCALCSAVLIAGAGSAGAYAAEVDFTERVASENTYESTGDDALPASYSSRDLGYVTSVKSQYSSSCWAYASTATLESLLLRNGIDNGDMSTSHMNMWATSRSNGKGWMREINDDGYPVIPIGYFTSWQGGVFVADMDEDPLNFDTYGDQVPTDLARYGVTSVRYLSKDDPAEIKRAIMDNGGVYSSFAYTGACFNSEMTSFYMPPSYNGSYSGHSIEVVGWDDNYPRTSFTGRGDDIPENDGAWLIKNSHGNNNSLGGYFYISYEDKWLFSTKFVPSFSLESFEVIDDSVKLIQNEIYGATYEFRYIKNDSLTYMNRLSFDSDYSVLDKVVFKTEALGASYTVYYVPDAENETPDADETHWTKLHEGTVDYKGYICADIKDFNYPDKTGSLAITIDCTGTGLKSSIGVGEWLTSSGSYVFINESERGQSFIKNGDTVQDVMDWYKQNEDDDIGGTFVIKAITRKPAEPTLLGDVNLDGEVNILDVTQLQRHVAEYITLEKTAAANADYNRDGIITVEDATMIQRLLAEFDV